MLVAALAVPIYRLIDLSWYVPHEVKILEPAR